MYKENLETIYTLGQLYYSDGELMCCTGVMATMDGYKYTLAKVTIVFQPVSSSYCKYAREYRKGGKLTIDLDLANNSTGLL